MATRTYCDHCGNTVQNPKVLSFGDFRGKLRDEASQQAVIQQAMDAMRIGGAFGGGGNGGVSVTQQAPSKAVAPIINVDLCDTCVPIWLRRVGALCKASDPEEKNV